MKTAAPLLLFFACQAHVDAPVGDTPAVTAPLPTVTAPDASAPSPDAGAPVAAEQAASAPFDAYAWSTAHGVADPSTERITIDGGCRPVVLGDPPREALWCEGGAPIFGVAGGESVFPLAVIDVDHGHLRELLRAPLYAGALDFDVVYVRLDATLSPDGHTITVSERPEQTCPMARAATKKLFPAKDDANGLRDWMTVIDRACAAAGRYVWQSGRFVRG